MLTGVGPAARALVHAHAVADADGAAAERRLYGEMLDDAIGVHVDPPRPLPVVRSSKLRSRLDASRKARQSE